MFDLFVRTYQAWRDPRQTAHELSRLSDAQLHDIGLTRADLAGGERKAGAAR